MERGELTYYYGSEAEQFTFIKVPKLLFKDERYKNISNSAKLLYGLMLERMSLSAKNGWQDQLKRVYIYYSVTSIMEDMNCSKMSAVKFFKELVESGLLEVSKEEGKANTIYVKNFVSQKVNINNDESLKVTENNTEYFNEDGSFDVVTSNDSRDVYFEDTSIEIVPVQKIDRSKNYTGTSLNSIPVPVQKLDPNKTEYNNTDFNYNPIDQSKSISKTNGIESTGEDKIDEAKMYMDIIRENIELDFYLENGSWGEKELYEELYSLICDVVCVKRKSIRISGEDYPYELVKSKFLKLRPSHLTYVIDSIRKNTTKIKNIKAYMITTLYNAPNTIHHYYTAEVNHDMYGT